MIYLITGPPGSGKSYYAVRRIDSALAAGRTVVTNVPLSDDWAERVAKGSPARLSRKATLKRVDEYKRRLLVIENPHDLMSIRIRGTEEGRAVAVLDEAARFLNPRTWSEAGRKELVSWFQGHRHYGFDVLLISQLAGTIDVSVRDLYEERVSLKNLHNFRLMGLRIFPTTRFVAIHTWNSKDRHILKRDTYGLSRRVAGMYNTHGLAESGELDHPDFVTLPLRDGQQAIAPSSRGKSNGNTGTSAKAAPVVGFLRTVQL